MEKKTTGHGFPEIAGYIWLIAAVLTFLSLVTYDSHDIGFNSTHQNEQPANFFGWVGAYWSAGLFFMLGMAAYLLPTLFICAGLSLIFGQRVEWVPRLIWAAVLLVSLACLLHLQHWFGSAWCEKINLVVGAGGLFGQVLDDVIFSRLLSQSGAALTLGLVFVVSLIYLFDIKPIELAVQSWQRFLTWRQQRADEKMAEADPMEKLAITEKKIKKERQALEKKIGKEIKLPESTGVESAPTPKVIDTTAKPFPPPTSEPANKIKKTAPVEPLVPDAVPSFENYQLPPLKLLQVNVADGRATATVAELEAKRDLLVETLLTFGIEVQPGDITKGATITRYEVYPAAGVRVDRIANLDRDIARALKAERINILAPIPGKDSVGIEVPNETKVPIVLRDLFETAEWANTRARIPIAIGKDVYGKTLVADLAEMPHLLIAGTTGSGKSVCINCIVLSLLYKFSPDQLRLILVDPKQVEMQVYGRVPHLVVPVVTEPKKSLLALRWVINEMEKRYKILAKCGVRNIATFNARPKEKPKVEELDLEGKLEQPDGESDEPQLKLNVGLAEDEVFIPDRLPYIVVIIDEMADLMQTSSADVEIAISRLAAKARAAGIHLILATQTPRREVITGVIKTNVPSRIAFQVPSALDSRVILDDGGAENLLGKGDLLYLPPGAAEKVRGQGAFVSDEEVTAVVDFVAAQSEPTYEPEIHQKLSRNSNSGEGISDEDRELIAKCLEVLAQEKKASTSLLQRRLRIGYNRAAWVMDKLFELGVVGEDNGAKPRDLLMDLDTVDFDELIERLNGT